MKILRGKNVWLTSYLGAAALVCAVTVIIWVWFESEVQVVEQDRQRVTAQEKINEIAKGIESTIARNATVLDAFSTYVALEPDLSDADFEAYARRTFMQSREFRSVALAPDLIVTSVFPLEGNQAAIGLDYKATPAQLAAVEAAIAAQTVVIAGPVDLVQGGRALIARKAVYTSDFGTFGSRFWGIVSLVLDIDKILAEFDEYDGEFDIALRGKDGRGVDGGIIRGIAGVFARDPVTMTVELPHGHWIIAAAPKDGWVASGEHLLVERLIFSFGALGFILVIWAVMRLVQLRTRADAQLTAAINSIEDGFAFYDSDDRLVVCNDKYREFYALSAEVLVPGTSFEDIIRFGITHNQYPDAMGREEAFLQERLKAHRTGGIDVEQKLSDGRWLQIRESRTPDGGIVGFRVDITELKNARDAAEAANTEKSEFLNVMSHELRTPLTVVLGGTPFLCQPELLPAATKLFKTLEEKGDDAAQTKHEVEALLASMKSLAGKVERSAKHLLTLINDVLDFSKIEAGRMELSRRRINLGRLVNDLVEEFSEKATENGLYLQGDVGEVFVEADELRLRQVFVNIIENALKFTEEGGVKITVDDRGAQVKISVADSGCGIPEDRIADVFTKFSQVNSPTASRAGGTGLGMAISKKILELHGGDISLQSTVGEGSTFTFTLQRALDVEAAAADKGTKKAVVQPA